MMRLNLDRLSPIGRSLMLPIAVLPVAGLMLRLGQADVLDVPFIAAAGGAIFAHLGLLFAIGVAVGLARENHGAAGLAGAVAYLVTTEGAKVLLVVPPEALAAFADQASRDLATAAYKAKQIGKLSVPAGILSGLIAGALYNRYSTIRTPEYLAFFGGRRFVPIVAGFAGLFAAMLFGFGFPLLEGAIDGLSRSVVDAGSFGLFLYGVLNRLLIVTGLHHIINNIAWFILGDFNGATGDLNRFFKGDPSAGAFMSGFFPIMMFGLPAACLAMYHSALPARRKAAGGLLLSLGLTSFLTGVTEPIEFSFMFLAPILYAVHAVLTGLSMVLMDALGVKLGFGFSAGLFDYGLNYGLSTRPLWLIPVGALYFGVYYAAFRFCIERFDLKTPGRETEDAVIRSAVPTGDRAQAFIQALGGAGNLQTIDACTTRLRLVLGDVDAIDEAGLKSLGARGVLRPGGQALQVVLGPIADQVAGEIRNARDRPIFGNTDRVQSLGGADNIRSVEVRGGRLRIAVGSSQLVQTQELLDAGARGVALPGANVVHIVVGPDAERWAAGIGLQTQYLVDRPAVGL